MFWLLSFCEVMFWSGQNSSHLDSLFTGNFLGHKSDIADGSLRTYEFRSFNNIVGDFYVAPRFMERIAVGYDKLFIERVIRLVACCKELSCWELCEEVEDSTHPWNLGTQRFTEAAYMWLKLSLIGTGKSFQTELTFKKMGCVHCFNMQAVIVVFSD